MRVAKLSLCLSLLLLTLSSPALADTDFPTYIQNARALIEQASAKAKESSEFSDAVLIGQNFLRNAEAEFKNNLSWGKLDQKAEPTVRYFASMAELQAKTVLSRVEKNAQEKERLRLEKQAADLRGKIKVFEDKVAEIAALKGDLAKRDASIADLKGQLSSKQGEIDQLNAKVNGLTTDLAAKVAALTATESKGGDTARELAAKQKTVAELEAKNAQLVKTLEDSQKEGRKLRDDLASLAAQKGAVESQSREQIEALNRQRAFVGEVGKLGGVIKSGSDNMTVIFARSAILKTPKNDIFTVEGDKTLQRIVDLLNKYPEFRAKVKVHGFGQPVKNEDAAATDRMARLIREALLSKGKFEPTGIEALGAGPTEPIYPKSNPEGNRRVEITFVKK